MGKSKTKKSYEDKSQFDPFITAGSQRAVRMATDRSNQAYENYGGQRIADLSQNEQMGSKMARDNVGFGDEDYANARSALDASGRSISDEGALEGFMNPYMKEVLDPQVRRRNEAFEADRATRQANAGMKGAFGGRQDLANSRYDQQHQQGQDELLGTAYGAAFDRATGMFERERDRDINRAGAYTSIAGQEGTQRQTQIRDLMNTGLVERTRDQADMDFKYLEHLEERDWDVSNLNTLVQTLAGVPKNITKSGTSTETTQDSPVKAIAGMAAITAGAVMSGGASLGMPGLFGGGKPGGGSGAIPDRPEGFSEDAWGF